MKLKASLAGLLESLNLTLRDLKDENDPLHNLYKDRKGMVLGVFDGDRILCTYASQEAIERWLREKYEKS